MTKSQLVQVVGSRCRLSAADAEMAVNAVLGEITEALGCGDRVELRRIRSFGSKVQQAK